jgi:hypothetical protein
MRVTSCCIVAAAIEPTGTNAADDPGVVGVRAGEACTLRTASSSRRSLSLLSV